MPRAGLQGRRCKTVGLIVGLGLLMTQQNSLAATLTGPLVLESTIVLEHVSGRLDHLAIDPQRQRLYVAELGQDSLGVIDLKMRIVLRTVGGLREPQGLGYVLSTDTLYVANGGDGSVRLLRGADLSATGRIELGADADNVLVDGASQRVYVGHGDGGMAVIDAAHARRIAEVPLKAHPENFQLDPSLRHLYVNVPGSHEIAVVDLTAGRQTSSWPTQELRANFPMAIGSTGLELWVAFRHPATLAAYRTRTGLRIGTIETCADADNISVDARRSRLYVTCGAGEIDVLEWANDRFRAVGRVSSGPGARTSLFDPDQDRLYVAAPASLGHPAAIYVYRPGSF